MNFKGLIFFFLLCSTVLSQSSKPDSVIWDEKVPKHFVSVNDLHTEIVITEKKMYVNHYRFRLSAGSFVAPFRIKADNPDWKMNSTIANLGIDLKASATLFKEHKLNMSFSYSLIPGNNSLKLTNSDYHDGKFNFTTSIDKLDLTYSYVRYLNEYFYVEFGLGGRVIFLRTNNPSLTLGAKNVNYMLSFALIRPLSEKWIFFTELSYSNHKMNLPMQGIPHKRDSVAISERDMVSIHMFQLKFGVKFLTIVADMFY